MEALQVFSDVISQNLNSAYRFAYTYTKNQQDAEDVVNESVIKAMRGIHSLREPSKIKPWFYRIIANTALTYLKNRQKNIAPPLDEVDPGRLTHMDDYSKMMVEDMLKTLDEKSRAILVLRYFERMTLSEIGEVLAMNDNTVKSRLYRTLEQLREDEKGAVI